MKNENEQHKEMQDILLSELEREAQDILAGIEADESLKDLAMPENSEEDLLERIARVEAKKTAFDLMADEDKEAIRIGREIQMQKEHGRSPKKGEKVVAFRKKKKHLYLLVAVVAVLAMMTGMVSIGEVPLMTKVSGMMSGNNELKNVDARREDEGDVVVRVDENVEAYSEIKNTFGVDIIKLEYRPEGTRLLSSNIDETLSRATIVYQCGETVFDYRMIFNYQNQSYGYKVNDTVIEEKILNINDISVELKHYDVEDLSQVAYAAEFVYQDVYYVFNATADASESEIEEILKNLKIF